MRVLDHEGIGDGVNEFVSCKDSARLLAVKDRAKSSVLYIIDW